MEKKEKKEKQLNLKLSLNVPSDADSMEIVKQIEGIFASINPSSQTGLKEKTINDINVRFTDKGQFDLGLKTDGYESRLWSKSTCKTSNAMDNSLSNSNIMDKPLSNLIRDKPLSNSILNNIKIELIK